MKEVVFPHKLSFIKTQNKCDVCGKDAVVEQAALPLTGGAQPLEEMLEDAEVGPIDAGDRLELERVVATVRQLNPEAQLVVAEKGDLPLDAVLDTGLFDEELGEVNPGWVQALNDEPTPETEEYGITSFVYRHRWPFHPKRLAKALEGDWSGVLRSKGFFWLATRPDVQAMWSQAGLSVMLEPLAEWMAAVPESEWEFETPEDRIAFDERWDPIVGDRQTEIVFIGIDMDEDEIRHRLDDCVLTGRSSTDEHGAVELRDEGGLGRGDSTRWPLGEKLSERE